MATYPGYARLFDLALPGDEDADERRAIAV